MLRFVLGLIFRNQVKTQEYTDGPICHSYYTGS